MRYIGADFKTTPQNTQLSDAQIINVPNLAAQSNQSIRQNISQVQQINSAAANTDAEVAGRPKAVGQEPAGTGIGDILNAGFGIYTKITEDQKKKEAEQITKDSILELNSLIANADDMIINTSEGISGYQRKGEVILKRLQNFVTPQELNSFGVAFYRPVSESGKRQVEKLTKETEKLDDALVSQEVYKNSISLSLQLAQLRKTSNPEDAQKVLSNIISIVNTSLGENKLNPVQDTLVLDSFYKILDEASKEGSAGIAVTKDRIEQIMRAKAELASINSSNSSPEQKQQDREMVGYKYPAAKEAIPNILDPNKARLAYLDSLRTEDSIRDLVEKSVINASEGASISLKYQKAIFTQYKDADPGLLVSLKQRAKTDKSLEPTIARIEGYQKWEAEKRDLAVKFQGLASKITDVGVKQGEEVLSYINRALGTPSIITSLGLSAEETRMLTELQKPRGTKPEQEEAQASILKLLNAKINNIKLEQLNIVNSIERGDSIYNSFIEKNMSVVKEDLSNWENGARAREKEVKRQLGAGTGNFNYPPLKTVRVGDVDVMLPFLPNSNITPNLKGYLENRGKHLHAGIDISAPTGTPLIIPLNGTVLSAGVYDSAYGNLVDVQLADGKILRFAHMDKVQVKVGQQILAGSQVGTVGSTGRSTGPHLHFEVRTDLSGGVDKTIDPIQYMSSLSAQNRGSRVRQGNNPPSNMPPNAIALDGAYILNGEVVYKDGTRKPVTDYTSRNPIRTRLLPTTKSEYLSSPDKNYGYKVLADDSRFRNELYKMTQRLGIPMQWMADVMAVETGASFNPALPNSEGSDAIGIIQFMPDTARSLGTSTEALAGMTRTQQLKYVELYIKDRTRNGQLIKTPQDLASAVYSSTDIYERMLRDPNSLRSSKEQQVVQLKEFLEKLGSNAGRKYETVFTPRVSTVHQKYVPSCSMCQSLSRANTPFVPHEPV